jgi:hypothetical protein
MSIVVVSRETSAAIYAVQLQMLFEGGRRPTRDMVVESHPNVEEHDVRMGHPAG